MKIFKTTIALAIMILLAPTNTNAQDLYYVHQDVVKPSKVMEYEGVLQEVLALAKKHNLQDTRWITLVSNNSNYSYVMPLANMAELDKPSFPEQLAEKAGKDIVSKLFDRMDTCYDTELNYTLTLDKELTYMPNGITQTPVGENYRNNHIFHIAPSNRAAVKEKMKAVKALFESKGSKLYYRVYKSGFGTPNEYYMVAVAAKDAEDMEIKEKANRALLGNDALQKALNELYFNSLRYEKLEGNIRPDISYSPNQ
tara:strand:+ start:2507 stop:3268 length:762 start_codon:yes stop_codon:yes gene_type:complete